MTRIQASNIILSLLVVGWLTASASGQHQFVYEAATPLPNVVIDGSVAHIHSQGLYVTDRHFLVTGRLETKPKKALLLRYARDLKTVEYIDVTPQQVDGETLDHPGGFDVDADDVYQIPLSTSHRRGPTLVLGYSLDPDKPLSEATVATTIKVDDHLGAICCLGTTMWGANWDTRSIYTFEKRRGQDGYRVTETKQRDKLKRSEFHVAVQDWKHFPDSNRSHLGRVIMGGLVKDARPTAIIQIAEIDSVGKVLETHRFESRNDVKRPITNEGLAVHNGRLFLLPEDLGRGAKVLSYKIKEAVVD